jgi:type III pantothenate kinase
MILAIDVGNSSTTVGLFASNGQLAFRAALETDKNTTRDQCAVNLLGVFQLYHADIHEVTGAIISSVVPPTTSAYFAAIRLLIGKSPMLVGPGIKTGLNIKAEIHNQLGADIVASSVAALSKYPTPIVLIDMGTATTISLISKASYEGCIIIPGVKIALEALSERAAELPHISIEQPPTLLGRNTIDAMRSGVIYGNAGMVDSMIERLEEAAGPIATVVATGRNGAVLRYCKHTIHFDADLLMDGLYLLYQKNAERNRK